MGGHTRLLPEEDRHLWTRSQLRDALAFAVAGLTAEELIFGEPTTGPGSDLEHASALARRMVLEYGMSEMLGPVSLTHAEDTDWGLPWEVRPYSEQTAATVDAEVRRLLREAHDRAHETLSGELPVLTLLADQLLEQETLHQEDLNRLLGPPAVPTRTLVGPQCARALVTKPGG
jgi:cell division protease FtsH